MDAQRRQQGGTGGGQPDRRRLQRQQGKTKIKVQAFPQASYNDAVVAAATAKKLPCILDTDAPTVPAWAFAGVPGRAEPAAGSRRQAAAKHPGQIHRQAVLDRLLRRRAGHLRAQVGSGPPPGPGFRRSTSRGRRPSSTRRWRRSRRCGKYPIAFDLGTGDTGTEWWTYAYSPFLQSFGGDLINRDDYKSADGRAERGQGQGLGRPGCRGSSSRRLHAEEVRQGRVRRLRQRQVRHGLVRHLEHRPT